MEFFDWINVVQIFTEYFAGVQVSSAAEYIEALVRILYISLGVAGGVYLVCLIFGGIGMHTMAKKVGMKHSWLAFLPFANTWYAGRLAGETQLFGKKMKRVGLYAMLAEVVYVAINVFSLVISFALYRPEYWAESFNNDTGAFVGIYLDTNRLPLSLRWLMTADIVCNVLNTISYLVLLFFLCVLFYAFFRKYYARGPFLMTFMCALLPLRGFVIFAVRNNTPVDYNAYMRRKMEEYRRQLGGGYGPYNGGGYDAYGNPASGGGGEDDPFSDFKGPPSSGGGSSSPDGGSDSGSSGSKDDPFPDF